MLVALGRWAEGMAVLDDALLHFAHAEAPDIGDSKVIIFNLLTNSRDLPTLQTRITELIELYNKHHVFAALGQGLVESISALISPTVSDATARMWRDVWQELAGNRKEFELPLRLLNAAVRYRETHDQRILLELPIEERKLLEPLLEQPQVASSAMSQ